MPTDEPVDKEPVDDFEVDEELEAEPRPEVGVAFTPRQILGGFVLLAALVTLILRRRRNDKSADR